MSESVCYLVTVETKPEEDGCKWKFSYHVCSLDEVFPKLQEHGLGKYRNPWRISISNYGERTHE